MQQKERRAVEQWGGGATAAPHHEAPPTSPTQHFKAAAGMLIEQTGSKVRTGVVHHVTAFLYCSADIDEQKVIKNSYVGIFNYMYLTWTIK